MEPARSLFVYLVITRIRRLMLGFVFLLQGTTLQCLSGVVSIGIVLVMLPKVDCTYLGCFGFAVVKSLDGRYAPG